MTGGHAKRGVVSTLTGGATAGTHSADFGRYAVLNREWGRRVGMMDYLATNGIIGCIREEANNVKECFTRFSFTAIALTPPFLSASAGLAFWQPGFALTAILVTVLLMTICRIGIYKYTTHNRNLGYQLHLERMADSQGNDGPASQMKWEEALFCWRVVQPELFRKIYITPETRRWPQKVRKLKMPFLDCLDGSLYRHDPQSQGGPSAPGEAPWYLLKNLTEAPAGCHPPAPQQSSAHADQAGKPRKVGRVRRWWRDWFGSAGDRMPAEADGYYPGSYMYTMFSVLYLLEFLSLVPLAVGTWEYFHKDHYIWGPLAVVITLFMGWVVFGQMRQIVRRRTILERELLSIHACGLTWAIVERARRWALDGAGGDYTPFTRRLSAAAHEIAKEPGTAPRWRPTSVGDPKTAQ